VVGAWVGEGRRLYVWVRAVLGVAAAAAAAGGVWRVYKKKKKFIFICL